VLQWRVHLVMRGRAALLVCSALLSGAGLLAACTPSTAADEVPAADGPAPAWTADPVPAGPEPAAPRAVVGQSDPSGPAPVLSHGRRDLPMVALTFDADMTPGALRKLQSGRVPSYANTALLEALRADSVPATLFLAGLWMQAYPELTAELAADPLFELGTHSWDHPAFVPDCYSLPGLPGPAMDQMTPTQALLEELAGPRATRLFRFPGGCLDEAALAAIGPAGVTAVQFDVAGADGFQQDPEAIVRTVLSQVQNGSIVVLHMHGGDLAPATAAAVPAIVAGLRARGFELVTVGRMLASGA
jgi:peptidoglycan/xylan/chitin deacetylase (PgdA/CDA1 family)